VGGAITSVRIDDLRLSRQTGYLCPISGQPISSDRRSPHTPLEDGGRARVNALREQVDPALTFNVRAQTEVAVQRPHASPAPSWSWNVINPYLNLTADATSSATSPDPVQRVVDASDRHT